MRRAPPALDGGAATLQQGRRRAGHRRLRTSGTPGRGRTPGAGHLAGAQRLTTALGVAPGLPPRPLRLDLVAQGWGLAGTSGAIWACPGAPLPPCTPGPSLTARGAFASCLGTR
eukprot:7229155-Lingulodinium_polyedra.AAC.1